MVERFWRKTLLARPHIDVAAVCSAGGETAGRVAARHGANLARDANDLISAHDIDTVLIATPPHTHLAIAGRALDAGKHVLVEKPLCATLTDARVLFAKGRQASGIFGVTFNNRLRENNAWVRDQVLAGRVGTPNRIDLKWWRTKGLPPEPWRADPERAFGGVLADLGSHLLSMGLGVLTKRRRFRARCRLTPRTGHSPRLDDRAEAEVVIDDHIILYLSTAWAIDMDRPVDFAFQVTGDRGTIAASDYQGETADGYGQLIDEFFDAVGTGKQPDLDLFEDVMIVLDALYRAGLEDRDIDGVFVAAG